MTYLMPAEAAPQDRVWMAFPSAGYSLGDTESEHHEARSTWAAVAHAIAEFEPVTMLVDPAELTAAKRYVSQSIEIVEAPLNDAWMRDIGPTFVHAEDGSVAAVNWVFNGWGAQDWAGFLAESPEDQATTAKALAQSAIGTGTDYVGATLAVLTAVVTVATGVGGVASAISALRAL